MKCRKGHGVLGRQGGQATFSSVGRLRARPDSRNPLTERMDRGDAVPLGEVAVRGYDRPLPIWQLGQDLDFRMQRRYVTVDVFTDRAFGGNPLAVVLDAGGLSSARMQAIATESNYSETTFVLPPQDSAHDAHVRIFTVRSEIPF